MNVLFLCPHGAAKSVVASALANAIARERELPYRFHSRGTDCDAELNPIAVSALEAIGLSYLDPPQNLSPEEIESADIVISLGVDREELPAMGAFLDWSDVPDVSTDVSGLVAILTERVRGLIDGLSL